MKIFFADGRLGNQLFQYVFLKTIQKNNEKIIVTGFEDLIEVFEINDIINLKNKNIWLKFFLYRFIYRIFSFLSKIKIISSVKINHKKVFNQYMIESKDFTNTEGLFGFITFVKIGYFQSEKFFDKERANRLFIKKIYKKKALKILKNIPSDKHKVFVHIRRGDYKKFTILGKSTLLPLEYYKKQIKWFLDNRKNVFFLLLSDEPKFVEKEFNYLENKLISINNHHGTDWAIMTLCKSAILSSSSFSWWGSYLMKERDMVFAPKHWCGFNSGEDCGSDCPSFSTEIDVRRVVSD